MSQTRRQGNIVLVSLAVFVLFLLSNILAEPPAGAVSDTPTHSTVAAAPVDNR
ncbi:MAG: hypothetical protein OER95_06940 [Acidimicrobiia bacterium]|nr:hypothetical protein [Acidimicrobiia bacterium]